jgi:hypothetical protein
MTRAELMRHALTQALPRRQPVRRGSALGKSLATELTEIIPVAFCQLTTVVLYHSDEGQ